MSVLRGETGRRLLTLALLVALWAASECHADPAAALLPSKASCAACVSMCALSVTLRFRCAEAPQLATAVLYPCLLR